MRLGAGDKEEGRHVKCVVGLIRVAPKAGGGGREDQPHAVAARAQEGLEGRSHVEGQEGQWCGDTPRPRYRALAVLC